MSSNLDKTKLEVIKKELKNPCYSCYNGSEKVKRACKICDGRGIYKENYYYHINNGICIGGDFIK